MNINLTLITFGLLCWISWIPSTNADIENDVYGPKLVIRTPRAISGLWKRFFGRRKQSGFQGTAQTQQPYNVAASTFYPAFVQSAFPVLPFQGPPAFGPAVATAPGAYPYPYSAHFTGFEGYTPLAQASSLYPAFSLPNTFATAAAAQTAQPGLSAPFDFHSYFEQLLRPVTSGSGSSSSGDQETSASTLLSTAVKPDGPTAAAAAAAIQNFKNLYSFPFQLSSEGSGSSSTGEQFQLQIPFGRKHNLRRSSQDKVSNVGYQIQKLISPNQQSKTNKPSNISVKPQQQSQKQQSYVASSPSAKEQIKQKAYNDHEQQLQNALFNPQEYIAQIIQQELVAQQAQLQGKQVDNNKSSSSSSSNDQIVSSSDRSSTYYPSSYYYGAGSSLPSAMTKPRATPINTIKQQQQIVTKKSTVDQPLRSTPVKFDSNSSPSSPSPSSSSSPSLSIPVNPSTYSSANSYPSRVYKE